MQQLESDYPIKSELWFLKRTLKYLCLKLLSLPLVFGILLACLKLLDIDLDRSIGSLTRGFSSGDIQSQLRYRPPVGMLRLLHHRFATVDRSWFERRERAARNFWNLLDRSDLQPGIKAILGSADNDRTSAIIDARAPSSRIRPHYGSD
jgi:perosamine synthetase